MESKHHTLGEQLTHQAPATRSKRYANRNFLLPRRATRQQEVRNVSAGNQKYYFDDHHQHHQSRLIVLTENRESVDGCVCLERVFPIAFLCLRLPVRWYGGIEDAWPRYSAPLRPDWLKCPAWDDR